MFGIPTTNQCPKHLLSLTFILQNKNGTSSQVPQALATHSCGQKLTDQYEITNLNLLKLNTLHIAPREDGIPTTARCLKRLLHTVVEGNSPPIKN